MTTVSLLAERLVELKLRTDLCACLAKQNAELEELMEMHAKGDGVAERQNEDLSERVDEICRAHALGVKGSTSALLGRIAAHMRQLQEWRERFEPLVKLCMTAERAEGASHMTEQAAKAVSREVDRITSEELPF
jgi:hypothetical protein